MRRGEEEPNLWNDTESKDGEPLVAESFDWWSRESESNVAVVV